MDQEKPRANLQETNPGNESPEESTPSNPDHANELYDPFADLDYANEQIAQLQNTLDPHLAQSIEYMQTDEAFQDILSGRIEISKLLHFMKSVAETGKVEFILDPQRIAFLLSIVFQDVSASPREKQVLIESLVRKNHPNVVQAILAISINETLENAHQGYFAGAAALLESVRIGAAITKDHRFESSAHFGNAFLLNSDLRRYAKDQESNYLLALRMRLIADENIKQSKNRYDFSRDYETFRISRDRFARFNPDDGRLYVSRPQDFSAIEEYGESQRTDVPINSHQEELNFGLYQLTPRDLVVDERSAQQEHSEDFQSYLMIAREQAHDLLQEDFGCDIRNLNLAEQNYFLQHLRRKTNQDVKILKTAARQNGIHFLRSFLSLEHGGQEMGEYIFTIAEQVEPTVASQIFARYGEIVDAAMEVENMLQRGFPEELERNPEAASQVREQLLHRGKDILVTFSRNVSNGQSPEELIARLDDVQTSVEVLKSTFATLRRSGADISLEDFQNNQIEAAMGTEVSQKDLENMLHIYTKNLQGSPQAVQESLLQKFRDNLQDPATKVSVFRHKEEIAGFMCFSPHKSIDNAQFMSAVNLKKKFHGATIGWAMIDEVLNREAKEHIIVADCVPTKNISARYIEAGFIGVRSWNDQGELVMDIVRNEIGKSIPVSKSLTQEEILAQTDRPMPPLSIATYENTDSIPFEQILQENYLTRYFKDATNNQWVIVTEPKPRKEA